MVEASVLHGLTIQQLRQRSDAIVSGKVINVRTERRGGRIETIARVRVEQSWRGVDTRTVTVRTLGGQLDGRQLRVAGAAQLRRGDKVLLFLYRSDRDFRPVGMFQGVWHLDRTDLGLARASDPAGASLIRPATGAAAVDLRERTVRQLAGRAGGEQ